MSKSHTSLTGSWSGAYRYPGDAFPETVFSAHIEERDGAFFGTTQEPNLVDHMIAASVLEAEIEGVRAGRSVTFTKFYQGAAEVDFAVRYEGEADEALTRIEGCWTIPNDWSGAFFMTRDDDGQAEAAERAEAAPVLAVVSKSARE